MKDWCGMAFIKNQLGGMGSRLWSNSDITHNEIVSIFG